MMCTPWRQNMPTLGNTSKDDYKLWHCHKGHWTVNYEILASNFKMRFFLYINRNHYRYTVPTGKLNFSFYSLQFPSLLHRHWTQQVSCKLNSTSESASSNLNLWQWPKGSSSKRECCMGPCLFSSGLTLCYSHISLTQLLLIFHCGVKASGWSQDFKMKQNTGWRENDGGWKERERENTRGRLDFLFVRARGRTRLMQWSHWKTWTLPCVQVALLVIFTLVYSFELRFPPPLFIGERLWVNPDSKSYY